VATLKAIGCRIRQTDAYAEPPARTASDWGQSFLVTKFSNSCDFQSTYQGVNQKRKRSWNCKNGGSHGGLSCKAKEVNKKSGRLKTFFNNKKRSSKTGRRARTELQLKNDL